MDFGPCAIGYRVTGVVVSLRWACRGVRVGAVVVWEGGGGMWVWGSSRRAGILVVSILGCWGSEDFSLQFMEIGARYDLSLEYRHGPEILLE